MQNKENLQDLLLGTERRDHIPVTVFLMNGYQMRGEVVGFDSFVLVLETEGRQQMIYKHAISTIVPVHAIPIT